MPNTMCLHSLGSYKCINTKILPKVNPLEREKLRSICEAE